MKKKKSKKALLQTQQLVDLKQLIPLKIGEDGCCAVQTEHGDLLVYILIQPDNISVLGSGVVLEHIRNLQNILQDTAELELLCLSSAQSYEENKRCYRRLAARTAANSIIAELCAREIEYLDEINLNMSTSREFAVILRFAGRPLDEVRHAVMQFMQLLREHRFHVHIAQGDEIKRMLSIYYVQDIYSDTVPDTDGEQYYEEAENAEA